MEMRQSLLDAQTYASTVAKGSVSLSDLMSCPASMFDRMTKFMFFSHASAMTGAQQKLGYMSQLYMPQMANQPPAMQQQYQFMLEKSLYEQERERFSQVEAKILNKQNTKAEQEVARLETQLKLLEQEETSVKESEDKAAQGK